MDSKKTDKNKDIVDFENFLKKSQDRIKKFKKALKARSTLSFQDAQSNSKKILLGLRQIYNKMMQLSEKTLEKYDLPIKSFKNFLNSKHNFTEECWEILQKGRQKAIQEIGEEKIEKQRKKKEERKIKKKRNKMKVRSKKRNWLEIS